MTHHDRMKPHVQAAKTATASAATEASSVFADGGSVVSYGELHPVGGGDPIPLLKTVLLIGRRESCDIVLRFPNVSGAHCQLSLVDGRWFIKDLGSSNGTKINGSRVTEGRIDPGGRFTVARHEYELSYAPASLRGDAVPLPAVQSDIFSRSLLASAGLENRKPRTAPDKAQRSRP
jgi:adenylate cyclase